MRPDRPIALQARDDGLNAWETARIGPPPALAGAIYGYSDYWERTGGFTVRRELPHAEGVLIVNLGAPIAITGGDGAVLALGSGEAFVAGVHLRSAFSQSLGAQAGMHVFLPLTTLRRLLAIPMDHLVDRVVGLDALLGAEARSLCIRLREAADRPARIALLDEALARRLALMTPLDPQQAHALHALRTRPDADILTIARDIGWSRKHMAARVRDAVGVGPRCFRRLLRFQELVAAIGSQAGPPDWSGLAQDAGYFDQSRMIREFREFSGLTPSGYVLRRLPDGGGLVEG